MVAGFPRLGGVCEAAGLEAERGGAGADGRPRVGGLERPVSPPRRLR